MMILAISDGELGQSSILTHWTSANGTKAEEYYTSDYWNDEAPQDQVGVKLFDATI